MKRFFFIFILFYLTASIMPLFAQEKAQGIKHIPHSSKEEKPIENELSILKDNEKRMFTTNFRIQDNQSIQDKLIKNASELRNLDQFIEHSIRKGAFPGCQIFASKNGEIIYKRNFGNYTYQNQDPINDSTLYDIASISKILGTTLAVMKLVEEKKINLNATLNIYLSNLSGTNKANILIKDLLLHQAGLVAWIPFYKRTLDSVTLRPRADLYRNIAETGFNIPVSSGLFMKNAYKETVWEEIINSPLSNKGRYVYSDLDFYFLEAVVEKISGLNLEAYLIKHFFEPLNLQNTLYNPWKKHRVRNCAPTETDDYYRYQTIQGYVHDQGAAMMGGVAGHAGLFSNVSDMAILLQMLNNGGVYNGRRYLKKETIQLFTKYNSSLSRRGYGFDKPEKKGNGGPTSEYCSKSTFGHQGFTGTCAWADPETGIIYIFLSNRVYPTASNRLINSLDIRNKAQSYIYKALGYGQ